MPLVEQPFALVQFLAKLAQFALAGGLLHDFGLFDFQVGLAHRGGGIAVGLFENVFRFCFRVAAAEVIQKLDEHERQHRRGHAGDHHH